VFDSLVVKGLSAGSTRATHSRGYGVGLNHQHLRLSDSFERPRGDFSHFRACAKHASLVRKERIARLPHMGCDFWKWGLPRPDRRHTWVLDVAGALTEPPYRTDWPQNTARGEAHEAIGGVQDGQWYDQIYDERNER
jgi:hypothetical protein